MSEQFNIITGFCKGEERYEFFDLWYKNTRQFTNNKICVINVDGEFEKEKYYNIDFINFQNNLGHVS